MATPLHKRFEVRPGSHVPHPVRYGVLVLALLGLFLYWGYSGGTLPFLGGGGQTVRMIVASGQNLRSGRTQVRVDGVDVGTISHVERTADGRAVLVTMNIDKPGVNLRSDASAQVYWKTLLGFQYYVALNPGHAPSPLGDAVIPESRTGVQVELDQVLAALTPPSRAGIQQTFHQFSRAFAPGNAAGASIDRLAPAMANVGPALNAFTGTGPGDLTNTVHQANRFLGELQQSDAALGDLVASADTAFVATDARRGSIDTILSDGPATLARTRDTMARLDHTLSVADPVVDALDPGARQIAATAATVDPALQRLIPLLDDARPTLVSLRPALEQLAGAGRVGTPLLRALEPTLRTLDRTTLPGLNRRGFTGLKLYEAIGPVFATVSDSAGAYDANGHVQRFQAVGGGTQSAAALPCYPTFGSASLSALKLNCDDLQTVFGRLLGLRPSTPTKERR